MVRKPTTRVLIAAAAAIVAVVAAGVVIYVLQFRGGDELSEISKPVTATEGGSISLGDDITLRIPPDALSGDAVVTITKTSEEHPAPAALEAADALAPAFDIDLAGATLAKPVTLEVAFDPGLLPSGISEEAVFLAYYDADKEDWLPVIAEIDQERNVAIIQTDHLSWWNPWTWNWDAWVAALSQGLLVNVTDFLDAFSVLTDDCPQEGPTVQVDDSRANNVVQGCVERDDPDRPELRVVNIKSFFYEVRPVSGGNGYPLETFLAPAESLPFQASTTDPAPLVISAEITQKAATYLIVHLVIQMLPGLNQFGIQGAQIACITERLSDVANIAAAAEALTVEHDGAAAAEQISQFLLDEDAMRRFISASDDCFYGAARTWSLDGIRQVGAATSTIVSTTDFIANYLLNYDSEVAFSWEVRVQTYTDVFAYCLAVGTVDGPDDRWNGPRLPEAVLRAVPPISPEATSWRCLDGRVLWCNVGVNLPCGKAHTSREPTQRITDYCQRSPNSQVPAAVSGHDNIYVWQCEASVPRILRQVSSIDARGFVQEYWHELQAPGTSTGQPQTAEDAVRAYLTELYAEDPPQQIVTGPSFDRCPNFTLEFEFDIVCFVLLEIRGEVRLYSFAFPGQGGSRLFVYPSNGSWEIESTTCAYQEPLDNAPCVWPTP